MAQSKSSIKAPRHDAATIAKAAQIEKRLRDHHALGVNANSQTSLSANDFAAKHGLNENTFRKLRAFARGYSLKQLDDLCAGRRPNGLPLHWGYVPVLLAVPWSSNGRDKTEVGRKHFQKIAIERGLSPAELRQAIHAQRPIKNAKPSHGRKIQAPRSFRDGVARIRTELDVLARRCVVVIAMAKGKKENDLAERLKIATEGIKAMEAKLRAWEASQFD